MKQYRLKTHIEEAEKKAIESLSRYKFVMFGYWTGVWVHLNQIERIYSKGERDSIE